INFQVSWFGKAVPPVLTVSTPAGSSDSYLLDLQACFGIFTLDGSGCGRGYILNVSSDGSTSLNSPSNSASPGDYITVFGTGLFGGQNDPPPGYPSPAAPLSISIFGYITSVHFDFDSRGTSVLAAFAGRAPGWVGLDQVNV